MLSLDHPVKTLTKCMQVPVQGEVVEAIAEGAEICQIAIPDAPWCWNIYLRFLSKHGPILGQYSGTMEHLGCDYVYTIYIYIYIHIYLYTYEQGSKDGM